MGECLSTNRADLYNLIWWPVIIFSSGPGAVEKEVVGTAGYGGKPALTGHVYVSTHTDYSLTGVKLTQSAYR